MDMAEPHLHDTPPTASQARPICPPNARPFVLIAAILASGMGFIDGSVVALATPAIRADLGASLVDAQWISNSYMLLLSSLVLLGGAAGDVFGVRSIFAAGITVFMVTSLACAVAPDAQSLIVLRALQGLGAAFMVPGSLAIIAKSYPPATRGAAIGTWAAFSSITAAVGPFIGGMVLALGDPWMWRLIFAINGPIALVALAMLFSKVPPDRPSERRRLDYGGAGLATISLGAFAWGLTTFALSPEQRFFSPWFWLAAGAVAAILFVAWERRARAPMVKLALFSSKAFSGANIYTLVLFFAFTAVLFFLPMTLISAWGAREWEVSVLLLPLSLFIAALSGPAGRFADKEGPRRLLTIGAALVGLSFALLTLTLPLMQMWSVTFPALSLMGLGMGLLVSPLSSAVMLAVPDEDTGLASGVNNAVARAAGLIAIAGMGALAGLVYAAASPNGAADYGALITGTGTDLGGGANRIAATNLAFQAVAGVSSIVCFLAAAVAWFTQPSWSDGQKPSMM